MYTHLSAGGNIGLQQLHAGIDAGVRDTPVFMKKWFRTDRAIVMYLTNGTLQVRACYYDAVINDSEHCAC